jgi:hypothetical protein
MSSRDERERKDREEREKQRRLDNFELAGSSVAAGVWAAVFTSVNPIGAVIGRFITGKIGKEIRIRRKYIERLEGQRRKERQPPLSTREKIDILLLGLSEEDWNVEELQEVRRKAMEQAMPYIGRILTRSFVLSSVTSVIVLVVVNSTLREFVESTSGTLIGSLALGLAIGTAVAVVDRLVVTLARSTLR